MQYLHITWKRSLRLIPAQLLIAVALFAGMLVLVFGAQKILYGEQLYEQQKVAVVMEDDSRYSSMLIKFVQQMDSVRTTCKFQMEDRDTAFSELEKGAVVAVMVVPQNVLEDIMNGTNTPVQVYMPMDATFESTIFGELLAAGASLLTTAQAQTYAVYDLALSADQLAEQLEETPQAMAHLHQYEREIDEWNLDRALKRERLFDIREINVAGKVSLPVFYSMSAGILITLLWGMGAVFLRLPEPEQTGRMLRRAGVNTVWQMTAMWLVETFWLFVLQSIYLFAVGRLLHRIMDIQVSWSITIAVTQLLTAMLCAAIQLLVYTLVKEQTVAVVLLGLLSICMLFASGGLIPATFLPEGINRVAAYLPTTWMLQLQSTGLLGAGLAEVWDSQIRQVLACLLGTGGFLAVVESLQSVRTR